MNGGDLNGAPHHLGIVAGNAAIRQMNAILQANPATTLGLSHGCDCVREATGFALGRRYIKAR